MPRLARLLRQRQPGGCPCRDRDRAGGAAHRPGHAWQGLGRDAAPLSGPGGGGVGGLFRARAWWAWVQLGRARRGAAQPPPISPWWPPATLLWVCLQGAFGALTVTMKLFPAIVTLHLAGGLVLLALLCVQAVRHAQAHGPLRPQDPPAQGAQG